MNISEMFKRVENRVVAYEGDIEIDRETIAKYPGCEFLLYARDWGTHLLMLPGLIDLPSRGEQVPYLFGTADREKIIRDKLNSARYFVKMDNEHHFDIYHYNKHEVLHVGITYTIPVIERWATQTWQAIREEDDFLRWLLS